MFIRSGLLFKSLLIVIVISILITINVKNIFSADTSTLETKQEAIIPPVRYKDKGEDCTMIVEIDDDLQHKINKLVENIMDMKKDENILEKSLKKVNQFKRENLHGKLVLQILIYLNKIKHVEPRLKDLEERHYTAMFILRDILDNNYNNELKEYLKTYLKAKDSFLRGGIKGIINSMDKPENAILEFHEGGGMINELIILKDFTYIYNNKITHDKYDGHVSKEQEIHILELINKYNEIYLEREERSPGLLVSSLNFWGNGTKKEISEEDQHKLRSIIEIIINTSQENIKTRKNK